MSGPGTNAAWIEALKGAILATPKGSCLFLEDREDLVVTLDWRSGLESRHTAQRGLAGRGALPEGRAAYLADPRPEDAEGIARAIGDARIRLPTRTPAGEDPDPRPARLDPRGVGALLAGLESEVRRHCPSAQARARWVGVDQTVIVVREGGAPVTDHRTGARVRLEARLTRDDRASHAVVEAVLPVEPALWADRVRGLPAALAQRLEARLRARPHASGETAAVFAAGAAGVVFHEVVGHALEADGMAPGTWLSRCAEGVVPRDLTVIDDPRRARVPWRIDDEGKVARPVLLLRDGRVRNWLMDERTAQQTGRPSTGHGRRASFREPVRPRMGCTFLAAGPLSAPEVLEGTNGIYVRRMESANADPASGTAVFRVTDSDLLEHGRPVVSLQPHLLVVQGARMLGALDRVGSDLAFDTCVGTCQRHAQTLAVSVGAPTIRSGLVTVIF